MSSALYTVLNSGVEMTSNYSVEVLILPGDFLFQHIYS